MEVIIIPKEQAKNYKQIRLNWHTGIDAVELEDGTFFISKFCYDLLPLDFKISIDEKEVDLKTTLSKLSIKTLEDTDYKVVAELEIEEIKIIK